jgi:hypothetical protein
MSYFGLSICNAKDFFQMLIKFLLRLNVDFTHFSKVQKKNLHITGKSCIITNVVTLIAVKREVAAGHAGVPWSECQVRKLATSHCTM